MSQPGDAPDPVPGDAHGADDDGPDRGDADRAGGSGDEPQDAASAAGDAAPRRRRRRRRRRGEAGGAEGEPGERGAEAASARPGERPGSGDRSGPPGEPRRDARGRDATDQPRGEAERGREAADRPHGEAERREADRRREAADRPRGEAERGRGDADRREAERRPSPGRGGEPAGRGRDEPGAGRGRNRGSRGEPRSDPRTDPRRDRRDEARRDPGGDRSRDAQPRGARPPAPSAASSPAIPLPSSAVARGSDAGLPLDYYAVASADADGLTLKLDPRRPVAPPDDLDLEGTTAPAIAWGKDDDGPAAEVVLAPDLPDDAPPDDPDPVTFPLVDAAGLADAATAATVLGDDVASVAGVRFVAGGRVQWCDAGEADYAHGERVVVDTDRGSRLAWVAVAPSRRMVRDRGLRRVIRRASEQDLRAERAGDADRAQALRIAKDKAAALHLPLKVFRVELQGQLGRGARLNVYYTSDERLDLRDFIRELSGATGGARIELRQLGVRDEAKAVGGIGSCGLTLCCTTWLPDFVPVSIKMAKDQGLVLSPTKVSGQCGRLKCCLVYEQAGYAELRKGLPKLGKRVIGARGEARVVEVDVLRQRVRVSYGPGDTEVVAASEVRPMFPSGNPPRARDADDHDHDHDHDPDRDSDDAIELDDAAAGAHRDDGPDPALPDDDGPPGEPTEPPEPPEPPDDDPSTAT